MPASISAPDTLWADYSVKPMPHEWRYFRADFDRKMLLMAEEKRPRNQDAAQAVAAAPPLAANLQRAYFESWMGAGAYRYLCSVMDMMSEARTLAEIQEKLRTYLDQPLSVVAARHRFETMPGQSVGETIKEYNARCWEMVADCKYNDIAAGQIQNVMLVQKFIKGLADKKYQAELLDKEEAAILAGTHARIYELCTHQESIKADQKILQSEIKKEPEIDKVRWGQMRSNSRGSARGNGARSSSRGRGAGPSFLGKRPPSGNRSTLGQARQGVKCKFCGNSVVGGFQFHQCKATSQSCRICQKKGHFARCCPRMSKIKKVMEELSFEDEAGEESMSQGYEVDEELYSNYDEFEGFAGTIQPVVEFGNSSILTVTSEERLPTMDKKQVFISLPSGKKEIVQMEMDSGAPCIFIPVDLWERSFKKHFKLVPTRYKFKGYGNASVPCAGYFQTKVMVDGKTAVLNVYVSSQPGSKTLLGLSAIKKLSLQIQPEQIHSVQVQKLIQKMPGSKVTVAMLREEFPRCFQPGVGKIPNFQHHIELKEGAIPYAVSQPRPAPLGLEAAGEALITDLEKTEVLEDVEASEWVCASMIIPKADRKRVRFVTDFKPLNAWVVPARYNQPDADVILQRFARMKYFSSVDISHAYYHIELTPECRHLTTTFTIKGLRQYARLPQGFCSSPAVWMRAMEKIFGDMKENVSWWVDDIVIGAETQAQHDDVLWEVFRRLNQNDIRVEMTKLHINVVEFPFAGYWMTPKGIRPLEDKVSAIRDLPVPVNVKQVQAFLGMVNFHSKYIPMFATLALPLYQLTRNKEAEKKKFEWLSEHQASYEQIKERLVLAPALALFDSKAAKTIVDSDASDYGIGGALIQEKGGKEVVCAYASRVLSTPEINYSTGEKECLAALWSIEKWTYYLLMRRFTLRTDHRALETLLKRGTKGLAPRRIQRWYERFLAYDYEVEYRPGGENGVADCLSRLPVNGSNAPVPYSADIEFIKFEERLGEIETELEQYVANLEMETALSRGEIKERTLADRNLCQLMEYISHGFPKNSKVLPVLNPYKAIINELFVVDGKILRTNENGKDVFVLPESLVPKAVHLAHENHEGIFRTLAKLKELFYWPGMNMSVRIAVENCEICNKSGKSAKPFKAPIQPVVYPMRPWAKVALDILGPVHSNPKGFKYFLVLRDYYSRWPEVEHYDSCPTSATVLQFLKETFARYGLPEDLVTDHGAQFISKQTEDFLATCGVAHSLSTPYNPMSHGMVERLNRDLRAGFQTIKMLKAGFAVGFAKILFGIRSTPSRATQKSPAELFLGRQLRTRLSAAKFESKEDQNAEQVREKYQQSYRKPVQQKTPEKGDFVRVKKPQVGQKHPEWEQNWFKIIRVLGPGTVLLEDGRRVALRNCTLRRKKNNSEKVSEKRVGTEPSVQRRQHRNANAQWNLAELEPPGEIEDLQNQLQPAVEFPEIHQDDNQQIQRDAERQEEIRVESPIFHDAQPPEVSFYGEPSTSRENSIDPPMIEPEVRRSKRENKGVGPRRFYSDTNNLTFYPSTQRSPIGWWNRVLKYLE